MLPHRQSCLQFSRCSRMGVTLRDETTLPNFLCTCIALQSENNTVQKTPTTMVTTESPNPVQNNSRNILTLSILTMHHPLSLSWQGDLTRRSPSYHFLKKTSIFTQIRGVRESPNFDAPARKAAPFLTLSIPVSHSLDYH